MTHYLLDELQEKLRTDLEVWRFFRESCLDGIWYWNLEKPEDEWMSPEFWRLFGYDPDRMPHNPESWFDIIHPDDKQVALANFKRHLADPSHPYDQIVRYSHADGHLVWVRCRGLAIRNENGQGIRMLGAHSDLTEFVHESEARERATATLAARLTAVFNAAQSGIVGLDGDRNVITLNAPARQLLGGVDVDMPFAWPKDIRFLDGGDMKPLDASADPVNRALAGAHLGGEVHLMTRSVSNTDARYVRLSSARVDAVDIDVHTVLVIDDVSEQEKNRQQIERQGRLDALGQLTGGIAHDFNNLLSTILYAISLAKKDVQTDRGNRLLDESLKTIQRGRDLTGRLLAFATHKSDAPSHRRVSDVLKDFELLANLTIEETISLTHEVADPSLSVFCDQHMLENALLNLVLNSRDAIMRSGKGDRIVLRAEAVGQDEAPPSLASVEGPMEEPPSDAVVKIIVSDNGPGMTPEVRRRATDPFFSTKSTNSGTGLGLSMVFGFVRQAGGWMRIASDPMTGTRITLALPIGVGTDRTDGLLPSLPLSRPRSGTLLLVEDEKVLLGMMSEQLEDVGYEVVPVCTGAAALQLLEGGLQIDALVSDIVMPGGIGGFELTRRLHAMHPEIPVVLLSGYAGYSLEDRAGINAELLQKPCQPTLLDETLQRMLGAARARRQTETTSERLEE